MGSSGGGGSSGKVDYPTYIKVIHANWLAHTGEDGSGKDEVSASITDVMNTALAGSPFATALAYNPDTDLADVGGHLVSLANMILNDEFMSYDKKIIGSAETNFIPTTDFTATLVETKAAVETLYSSTEVNADIEAYADLLDAQIEETVLPRFRRGMQDINAIQSSAFVIGASLIEVGRTRDIAKYGGSLRLQNYQNKAQQAMATALSLVQLKLQALQSDSDLAYRMAVSNIEFQRAVVTSLMDFTKTKIIAKKEESEANLEIDEKDARWDLEVFKYGANLLASAAGGTVHEGVKNNKFTSALGGALSGAGAGASIGGVPGAAIGGAIGLIGGLFG